MLSPRTSSRSKLSSSISSSPPPKKQSELRTAIITLILCAVSYFVFVFVLFSLKEIAVRSVIAGRISSLGGGGKGIGVGGLEAVKTRIGGMVAGRRMFENKGH
jgi:hypothetical protein